MLTNAQKEEKMINLEEDLKLVSQAFDLIDKTDVHEGDVGTTIESLYEQLEEAKDILFRAIEDLEEQVTEEQLTEWKMENQAMLDEYIRSVL